jgi:tRNA(Ile)-lysidine synthase
MLERVAAAMARYRMVAPGDSVGVAVSGGADSVCLLYVLRELAPRWNLRLSVLHLNHRLRGEDSRRDAEFVADLAAQLGFRAEVREADVAAVPGNLEQAAREARLAFFREAIAGGTIAKVAVGHTRSDQAETVLFRFLRGAGSAGLAGIRPVTSEGIVRPLLGVTRAEVEEFLRARGLPWREDATNRSLEFARNRIRHELLPELARNWNPAIAETLANLADWACAEEEYWERELDRLSAGRLSERQGAVFLRADDLRGLPLAAARRLLRRAMERVKGDLRGIDFQHISTVLELASSIEGHGRVQAPGLDIFRSFEWLRIARPVTDSLASRDYAVTAELPGVARVPARGIAVSLELIENSESSAPPDSVYNNSGTSWLDGGKVTGPLELRNWRPGDQYWPLGSAGREKIKTFFQEARIPLWERRHWPVLTAGGSIVWARKFGPDARVAAGPGCRALILVREVDTPAVSGKCSTSGNRDPLGGV